MSFDHRPTQTVIRTDLGAIFVSMELSRSVWLITSLSPGAGEKMSKHATTAGDIPRLLMRFAQLQAKAQARTSQVLPCCCFGSSRRQQQVMIQLTRHSGSS